MTSDANKLERIREAVEKLVPIFDDTKEELAYFAALCLDICHEDDTEAVRELTKGVCPMCYDTGMVRSAQTPPGQESPCDTCAPEFKNN